MARGSSCRKSGKETDRCRYWRKQIQSWEGSGETQTAFCREHGLSVSAFGWWKGELKRRQALKGTEEGRLDTGSLFVPVHVGAPGLRLEAVERVEVVLRSGHVLRVPTGFEDASLIRLLDLLESRC